MQPIRRQYVTTDAFLQFSTRQQFMFEGRRFPLFGQVTKAAFAGGLFMQFVSGFFMAGVALFQNGLGQDLMFKRRRFPLVLDMTI